MADFIELDFLGVETDRSGDAITLRYSVDGAIRVHVVDGGYLDTGAQIVEHIQKHYNTTHIDHLVLTHSDQDHANGLRTVLEHCSVGVLWMNRPWLYADALIRRFENYQSVDALRSKLRSIYAGPAALEDLANAKGVPIASAFQGADVGRFRILAPTQSRYMDLIVESNKTPEAVSEGLMEALLGSIARTAKTVIAMAKAAWGFEYFPVDGTSAENEMSVVQYATVNNRSILLTGDVGRDGLHEAADYAPMAGASLPGIWAFQVPHHGGRHNVNTEVLDRWLGPRLQSPPVQSTWNAICSSAKKDVHHPKKSVVRAMLHRGAHFAATEGRTFVHIADGITVSVQRSHLASTAAPPEDGVHLFLADAYASQTLQSPGPHVRVQGADLGRMPAARSVGLGSGHRAWPKHQRRAQVALGSWPQAHGRCGACSHWADALAAVRSSRVAAV